VIEPVHVKDHRQNIHRSAEGAEIMSGTVARRYLCCSISLLSIVCMPQAASARDRAVSHADTKNERPKSEAVSAHPKRPGDGVREDEPAALSVVVKLRKDGRQVIQHEGDATGPSESEAR
jgi:hypothetical protein